VLDAGAERRGLDRLGLDDEVLSSGCCGMAGTFGFEVAKYDVSMAAAERVLLPRIRAAPEDVLVIANGFSCREQIEQGTGRRTLHIGQIPGKGFAA
jgi:Fe-S oxidoreductase